MPPPAGPASARPPAARAPSSPAPSGPPAPKAPAPSQYSTRAGVFIPQDEEESAFDLEAPTGEFDAPSGFDPNAAEASEAPPPPMQSAAMRPPRPTEAQPMAPMKTMMVGSAQPPQQPKPVAAKALEPEPAPEQTRMRAKTQPGYPVRESSASVPSVPTFGQVSSIAPSSMDAPSAGGAPDALKLEAPAPALKQAPYKQPPRFALWLILALVMAIIAALVWWFAS